MAKANQDIRKAAKEANVNMWQVADAYGLSESGFCKRMRFEFSPEEKKKVFEIIERLEKEEREED